MQTYTNRLSEIDTAHTVSKDKQLLAHKFTLVGSAALWRVIKKREDHTKILASLQVLRHYWLGEIDHNAVTQYCKNYQQRYSYK